MTLTRAPFFVISGADGVGKTTTVRLAARMLEEQGISVYKFHHMIGEKSQREIPENNSQSSATSTSFKPLWKLAIPLSVKMLITSATDEYKYIIRIRRLLANAINLKQVALSDRYVYDRLITIRLKKRPLIHQFAVRLVCLVLRKPTLTIIITEKPDIVRGRRQELSRSEISLYQSRFIAFCQSIGAPLLILPAGERAAELIAQELTETILKGLRQ